MATQLFQILADNYFILLNTALSVVLVPIKGDGIQPKYQFGFLLEKYHYYEVS